MPATPHKPARPDVALTWIGLGVLVSFGTPWYLGVIGLILIGTGWLKLVRGAWPGVMLHERRAGPLGRAGWCALAGIAVVAVAFRMLWLLDLPPGLYIDEAGAAYAGLAWEHELREHGIFANWAGAQRLTSGVTELSNLYLTYVAGVLAAFGRNELGIRMTSVLPSLAWVALVFLLTRQYFGTRAALLAAACLAMSYWGGLKGRNGWNQLVMTALQLASVIALDQGIRRGRLPWSILAGVSMGLCLHTYVGSRLAMLHLIVWGLAELVWHRDRQRVLLHFGTTIALAGVLVLPFALLNENEGHTSRTTKLWAFSEGFLPGLRLLLESAWGHVMMFHHRGGSYARDNIPGHPMLDPISATCFAIGLALVFRRFDRPQRMLATFFGCVVLGGLLSVSPEGAPYVYRVNNLHPWAAVFVGVGAAGLYRVFRTRIGGTPRRATLAAGLGAVLAYNAVLLFAVGPWVPDIPAVHGTIEARLGRWVAAHPDRTPVFVHDQLVLAHDPYVRFAWAPHANHEDVYHVLQSTVAMQLAAGSYEKFPALRTNALAPPPLGEIFVFRGGLPRVAGPMLVCVRPDDAVAIAARLIVHERHDLIGPLEQPLAVLLWAELPPSR